MCVLTAIRIPSPVRRAYEACRVHLPPIQVLVFEFSIVDARGASPITVRNVAALYHKLINDAVEGCLGVAEAIVLAGAELTKTVHSLVSRAALLVRFQALTSRMSLAFDPRRARWSGDQLVHGRC